MSIKVDRAALVRRAMVEAVAELGLHGASMSQVAQRAGVATGTAYVHYESKEDLLLAAFVEVKRWLADAAVASVESAGSAEELFAQIWRGVYATLRADRDVARFLIQVEASPLRERAHHALHGGDALTQSANQVREELIELPEEILYDLGLAPAVRLAASGTDLNEHQLDLVASACWRAIKK